MRPWKRGSMLSHLRFSVSFLCNKKGRRRILNFPLPCPLIFFLAGKWSSARAMAFGEYSAKSGSLGEKAKHRCLFGEALPVSGPAVGPWGEAQCLTPGGSVGTMHIIYTRVFPFNLAKTSLMTGLLVSLYSWGYCISNDTGRFQTHAHLDPNPCLLICPSALFSQIK